MGLEHSNIYKIWNGYRIARVKDIKVAPSLRFEEVRMEESMEESSNYNAFYSLAAANLSAADQEIQATMPIYKATEDEPPYRETMNSPEALK